VSRAEEAQLSHLHAEALEESMRQDFLEETEYMERPDRPESDSTMASDMKEAKEGPLKSAMTSPESSKTPYQGKETARVRISLPESLTESELGELPTYSKGLHGADATRTSTSNSGEHSYGLFSRGFAAGQAARTKFRRTFSLKAAISRVKPHRVADRHQFWNTNFPQDYSWLEPAIWSIAKNVSRGMKCKDSLTEQAYLPLFFVLGACPNAFCGMQAVMYSSSAANSMDIDFWWVKPQKDDAQCIETETLSRQAKGPHKNDPGRSKPFYKPIADLFTQQSSMNALTFGIEDVADGSGGTAPRALIHHGAAGSTVDKHYLTMVWQEEWTQNPFSRHKYIKGKIVYQKDPEELEFFTKAYTILDGKMMLSEIEDSGFPSPLPGEDVKYLDHAP